MARGTCYFITRDANDNGEEFDESTLVELAQYEFDRVTDVRGDERRQSIADLLAGFQKMGAAVDGDAVTFGDCFRTKWFTESFRRVQEIVASKATALKAEYRLSDPGMEISCEEIGAEECNSFVDDCARQAITLMRCLPNGIQRMSLDIPGLVQTSLNMGIVQTTDTALSISYAVRSSLESEKQELTDRIELLAHALGATVSYSGPYPAWEYPETSPLRDTMCEVFERMYGRKPVIQALHAGVECGLFAGKLGNLDAVSFGPDMKDIHTPQESLDSASVARTWDYLLEVLKELK